MKEKAKITWFFKLTMKSSLVLSYMTTNRASYSSAWNCNYFKHLSFGGKISENDLKTKNNLFFQKQSFN